jgi:diguanylate cyclase (GGDEF)-like protein
MKSIRIQMIISLFLATSLVFFGLYFFASNRLNTLPDIVLTQYQEITDARANELENEIVGMLNQIEMIALSNIMTTMDLSQIQPYLISISEQQRFRNFTVSDIHGNAWATYGEYIDISNQQQYLEIIENGNDWVISYPFYSPYIDDNIPIITISHAIKNNGQTVGLVNGVVSTGFIDEVVQSITFKGSGFAWIVDERGQIVSHPQTDITIDNSIDTITLLSNTNFLAQNRGNFLFLDDLNVRMLGIFATINHTSGWKLVLTINENQAFAEIYAVLDYINISLLVCLLIMFLFALFYAKHISTPILRLKNIFEEATKGNFNVKADESINNEVGDAGKSFNKMLTQLKQLTYIDPITGLNNYFSFLSELPRLSESVSKKNMTCYVVIISIDDFKKINTIYGYEAGNETLRLFTSLINEQLTDNEMIARYFGDEMILSMFATNDQDIQNRMQKIIITAQQPMRISNLEIHLDVRCGIAIYDSISPIDNIIRQATLAKHKAKNSDDTIVFYNQIIDQEIQDLQALEAALEKALINQEFYLVYQPIVFANTKQIKGYEALLRWNHPTYKNIGIDQIIKLAESNGMIVKIGQWVITQACKDLIMIRKDNLGLTMSINISPMQLRNSSFLSNLNLIFDQTGCDPKDIQFEITEHTAMLDIESKRLMLDKIKELGVVFSMDDFGTGYSSLIYISQLPINSIKIDKSFIQKMLEDDYSKTLILAIITLANSLYLDVVAEGVETQEQFDMLVNMGCHYVQGYYISTPKQNHELI